MGALLTLTALSGAASCGPDSGGGNPPPVDHDDGSGPDSLGSMTAVATDSTAGSGDTGDGTADDTADSGTTGPVGPENCDDVVCEGHGACIVDETGLAYCACDDGYMLSGDTCVVDTSCVELRFLEDRCRQIFNGPPAVSLFFALDFCAGTAVTPEQVEQLGLEFRVLENGVDITENVESEATIIEKEVESYVTLVIDMSDSVTESEDLPALVSSLRSVVETIEPAAGESPVYVSVYVFGRFVREYVPFSRDFAEVDAALAAIEADPASVVALINGSGTSLYEAVRVGINRTQRIRELRDAVTWGGVLTTGTVVVVTDGNDTSNGQLDTNLVSTTLNQVISIGISANVDDEDLTAIGRDGNFLAPTPDQWQTAFAEIAERVDGYPSRSYLLAYCSSATQGDPEVTVTMAGEGVTVASTTTCRFIAEAFSSDPGDLCTQQFFDDECLGSQCGGLTACGACADDECCDGSQCASPVAIDSAMLSCEQTDMFCDATGEICVPGPGPGTPDVCAAPDEIDGDCDPGCDPGVSYCYVDKDMKVEPSCDPAFVQGSGCEGAQECQSLNCQQTNPDNPFEPTTCQPPALLFDTCEVGMTVCEKGGFCQGGECTPMYFNPQACSHASQCRSGRCAAPIETTVCVPTDQCYWTWDEKFVD